MTKLKSINKYKVFGGVEVMAVAGAVDGEGSCRIIEKEKRKNIW